MKKALQEKLAGLLTQSEAIRLKYDGKAADMTASEEQEWSNLLAEAETTKRLIENIEREEAVNDWAKTAANALPAAGAKGAPADGDTDAAMSAYRKFLRTGAAKLSENELGAIAKATSIKAYQADNPAGGGFLVLPQQMAMGILTLMKDLVFMRGLATVVTAARSESFGIAAIDTDPADADWTTELGTGSEESTMAFGKRELRPHPVAKRIKLSNKLIRQVPNVESVVQDRLGYKFGVTEEKAFLTGTGANQPLGVFTPSSQGISTARDVVTSGATAITGDELINVLFMLKPQYRARSRWILGRDVIKYVRKIKDSTNNYLWATGLGPGGGLQGVPDTLCGRPVLESEYAPATITTGLYTAILGDFAYYHIADALDMQMQVLTELYAETNQTGYILRRETDGLPVLEEAFARLKQA